MPKTPKGTVSLNSQNTLQLPNDHSGKELRLILGDQLNAKHSWFRSKHDDVVYLIAEIQEEATYTRHHIQKVCGFFLAMENFASAL
ncbi:MAG: cryptochrome/photolyase family protein, partial [Pseudomonadales bacterium]|nr:cryptochrome/photolyase family protein [Pseudomonadales bacterium]